MVLCYRSSRELIYLVISHLPSHIWLCNPMNCSTPGFPVLHYLPEFALTQVYWVSVAIQPSHPQSPPCPLALSLSHHWSLFQWFHSLDLVAKVLELQFQHQSFQWIFRVDFLYDWLVWSSAVQGISGVFSSTTIGKHQFFSTQPSLWSKSHICTWLLEKPHILLYGPLLAKWCLCFLIFCLGLSWLFFHRASVF